MVTRNREREAGRQGEKGIANSVPQSPTDPIKRRAALGLAGRSAGWAAPPRRAATKTPWPAPGDPRALTHFSEPQAAPLARPLGLRLRDQLLHSKVRQNRRCGHSGGAQGRHRALSAEASPNPRGADTSTKMAATAPLQLRGRDFRKEPISVGKPV